MSFWDKLGFKKNKAGEGAPDTKQSQAKADEKAAAEAVAGLGGLSMPDLAAVKKVLPKLLKTPKGLEALKKAKEMMEEMQKQGVDMKDRKAVEGWLQKKMGGQAPQGAEAGQAVQPFVRDEPAVGRNEPCHCGSGKKFKKCHGVTA